MKQKTIIILMIIITLINTVIPIVNAVEITKADLINDHNIKTHIKQYNSGDWYEIKCNYICYKEGTDKYPAYCIVPGIHGVDEEGDYTVKINELLNDKLIYNIIINGYPYKTPSQLGVETTDDAYVATKHAIKSVLLNRDIMNYYKPMDEKGEKIINAIYNIAKNGKEGVDVNKDANLKVNKTGNFKEGEDVYYQEYNVTSDVNISEYKISKIENFPTGTYISDLDGNLKDNFNSKDKFRINVPKESLDEDINGNIYVSANCNTKPVFYGEAPSSKVQNYAVTYKPYVEYTTSITMNEKTNTSKIRIIKKDKETLKPIDNVIFGLYKEGKLLKELSTNNNGIVEFENLYKGEYLLKEIKANDSYEKNDTEYKIITEYNKEITKEITNMHKKGNLKIIKRDKDNENIFLDGIEFEVIDSNKNIIANLITDENGQAQVNNINIGNYLIKETKTKENYNICNDKNAEVKWNETSEVIIENEKKKGQIKITKEDEENNKIKLEHVEFQIIKDNTIIETIKTDANGEAVTSRLPIGKYNLREVSLGNNTEYILNDSILEVSVEEDKINEIHIKNKHKKGSLKIIKVDKDDVNLTLGAIEFDLLNSNKEKIAHLITDANGEAYVKDINTGNYILKETKTKREYNICTDKETTIKWNEVTELVVENEKKKGQIKIIKEDKDFNEIKLEGVEFEIFDKNNKVIEKIKTNKDGEAITSKLPIGEYIVREVSLGTNKEYYLDEQEHIVKINDNEISEIHIQNEHKKGTLKIYKIDKDDKEQYLAGVEFEIIDEDGNKYRTITDENGIAILNNIRTGKVKLEEIKTKKEYVLLKSKYEIDIYENKVSEIIIENEKKKGQVEIYKVDRDNQEIKIPNVEFEIKDKQNNIVDKVITDKNGYAISKKLPIGEYYIKETKNNEKYVIDDKIIKVIIRENQITDLYIKNAKIKGKIKIVKTSSKDSPMLNISKGEYIPNIEFEIYNNKNELVDNIITNEDGIAMSKDLEIGRYKIKEKNTSQSFIVNNNDFFINIEKNNEIKILNIENDPIIPKINIEKNGQEYAEKNEEIKYEFYIENKSNTYLENFTWKEIVPYEKIKVNKLITGIYNENVDYKIYYKTNQNDYILLKNANSLTSEYIDLSTVELLKNEQIIELKVEYGTVPIGFKSIINPIIFANVKENVKKNETIINKTEIYGNVNDFSVSDTSIFETIIKEKEIVKKLPKTGC